MEKTPIHSMRTTVLDNRIFIKRDDLLPFSFGGNKYRKAMYYFEDLLSKGYNAVVTIGSASSNHCRIIANLAIKHRIKCSIVSPLEFELPVVNRQLTKLLNANIRVVEQESVRDTVDEEMENLKLRGFKPYRIEMGGHGFFGTKAYFDVYKEIKDYNENFDYIFFADGTGTTHAGLLVGKTLLKGNEEIIGISVLYEKEKGLGKVLSAANEYLMKDNITLDVDNVNYCDEYTLGGYGKTSNEVLKTILDVLVNDGIPLDHTYTGKAYFGMLEYLKKNQIRNKSILFIHTGGTPIFFDTLSKLSEEDLA